jgi:DNA-binding transcriptional MerR regulator
LTLELVPGFIFKVVKNADRAPSMRAPYMRPAELAQICGLSTDALRHYERCGILRAGRSANGYREYPAESVDRVQMVRHALSVGFTLNELARLLKTREKGGAPCQEVRTLAAEKLNLLEDQLLRLSGLRNELRTMLARWDTRLAHTKKGEQAHLLDMLPQLLPASRAGLRGAAQGKMMHSHTGPMNRS